MIRQRLHGCGEGGVVVAVLDPAVAGDHVIAHPAGRWRRRSGETQGQFVAGVHDYVTVIDLIEQRTHVAEARVVALQVAPDLCGRRDVVVVGNLRRRGVRLMDGRVAAITEVGRRWIDVGDFQGRVRQAARPLDLVPVDFEVGAQAEFVRGSRGGKRRSGR